MPRSRSRRNTQASATPNGALNNPMIMASTSSWRTMRSRPAPSAVRIEISRCRIEARASSRLATFEQAMRRTSVTAPIIDSSASSISSGIIHSSSDRASALQPSFSRGYAASSARADALEVGVRLLARHARLEAREDLERARIARLRLEVARQRHPQPMRLREHEPRRHHADHRVRDAVDGDAAADDGRIGVVAQPPHFVAQHHHRFRVRAIVLGPEVAAEHRRRAEQPEQTG